MRVMLYVIALVVLLLVVLFGLTSKKGAVWKSIFTLLQVASLAGNNGPGYR